MNGITGILEGVQSPLLVARAVVTPQTKLVPLQLIDIDLAPVTLYKGTKLANAKTMNDGNINVVVANVNNLGSTSVPQLLIDYIIQMPDDVSQAKQEKDPCLTLTVFRRDCN